MKRLNRTSNIAPLLLLLGIVMQFLHLPGSGLTLLISVVFSLVCFVLKAFVGKAKDEFYKENLILHAGITLFMAYLVFRLMFWGFTKMIFPLMLIAIILGLIVLFSRKYKHYSTWIIWFVFLFASLGITQVRSYQIFELRNKDIIENNNTEHFATIEVLDRYAWFLNLAKKYDEAEAALQKALDAYDQQVANGHSMPPVYGPAKEDLLRHQAQLNKREWKRFP